MEIAVEPLHAQVTLYGTPNTSAIFTTDNISTPTTIAGPYTISGMTSGQRLIAIGTRPDNGLIYALGYDPVTFDWELYALTGSGTTFAASSLTGTIASFDPALLSNPAEGFSNLYGNDLLVYPNPTTSQTHIVMPLVIQAPVSVYIIDMNGNMVRTYQYAPGSNVLDVDMGSLTQGIYSVRLSGKYITDHNLRVVKE